MKSFHVEENDPRTALQRMVEGDWYIADDPEIQRAFGRALAETARFDREYSQDPEAAQGILRELLGSFGEGAHAPWSPRTCPPGASPWATRRG